jgi:CHAT domain-containing protein/Tfp pilus assembly protein PilF
MRYQRLTMQITALSLTLTLGLTLPCRAQESPNNPTPQEQPQQPQHQDAPAPKPHPDLQTLVDAIPDLINERKHENALQQADALLQQATEKGDEIGQAYAHRFRAQALQRLNRLEDARQAWERAEALWREIGDGAFLVEALLGRAFCLWRTDEAQAERLVEQALGLAQAERERPLAAAGALNTVGVDFGYAGVLGLAQRCFEGALAIRERLAPNSLDMARTLMGLGTVAFYRGDLEGAQRYLEQALAIRERLAPNSLDMASMLNNLGAVAFDWGDLDLAQRYLEQALAIRERLAPNSLDMAGTLNGLGNVAYRRGDLEGAQRYLEQALNILNRLAPNSLQVAATLNNLGTVAFDRGDLDLVQRYYEQALAIRERLAPNSLDMARTLGNLARLALARNQPQQAIPPLRDALTITEAQRQAVPDPETRALFAERYYDAYPLLALAYLQLNQPAQAAETLERSRARSLAETLQLRQLARASSTPKPLQQLLGEYDKLHAQRLRLAQQADANDRLQQYRALDQQQRELDQRLCKEFPSYANLIIPQPLIIQQIQQSLDAGTVLLYHALLEDHLLIVAVSRTQVRGFVQKVDGKQLERQVERFREAVGKPPVFRTAPERRDVAQLGQALYKQLIAPAQGMLQNAQRVLLCPDGVLSQLPWAALVVQVNNGKPVYWIERVALHLTPSVGVYRQARRVQPIQQGAAVVAVWNYTNGKQVDLAQRPRLEVAMLLRRSGAGTALTDLPKVPDEVKALRRALGKGVRAVENAQATPQRARQAAQGARVVHFACHARADNVEPLRSALLLAPAGLNAGLLTAGEVLLNWRLRADVVMLSACETGLGLARRYEGVYSLGRAFLAAGSRSVGASLWRVDDKSTAQLMTGFYGRYARGVAKDVALREAQLALLRGGKYKDPYYWSGFVLMGDYK